MDSETLDEIKRHFGIVTESLRDEIRAVAEGQGQQAIREELTANLEGLRQELREEFLEVKAMIRLSYAELERRLRALETDVTDLRGRLDRLEARLAG